MTEDLAGTDDGDHRFLVDELERALADHIELGAGRAALEVDGLARIHRALHDGRGYPLQLVGREPDERLDA